MVNPDKFKQKITTIISQDYKVEFLGKNFNQIVYSLSETKTEKIYSWVNEVFKEKIRPIVIASKKPYKEWRVSELLTFRYPFSIGNTEYRIMFVKVKNSIYNKGQKFLSRISVPLEYSKGLLLKSKSPLLYIEFHLGDHKYYPQ
ncbi:MAG: hypothetical protein KKH52_03900 [Nanoarchaeota archaeon]|nr:hypothetical protein [Nanoarchaeota archaeon]MBU1974512.1 hypothetical protein [Nanoarchaeota archaeon]